MKIYFKYIKCNVYKAYIMANDNRFTLDVVPEKEGYKLIKRLEDMFGDKIAINYYKTKDAVGTDLVISVGIILQEDADFFNLLTCNGMDV